LKLILNRNYLLSGLGAVAPLFLTAVAYFGLSSESYVNFQLGLATISPLLSLVTLKEESILVLNDSSIISIPEFSFWILMRSSLLLIFVSFFYISKADWILVAFVLLANVLGQETLIAQGRLQRAVLVKLIPNIGLILVMVLWPDRDALRYYAFLLLGSLLLQTRAFKLNMKFSEYAIRALKYFKTLGIGFVLNSFALIIYVRLLGQYESIKDFAVILLFDRLALNGGVVLSKIYREVRKVDIAIGSDREPKLYLKQGFFGLLVLFASSLLFVFIDVGSLPKFIMHYFSLGASGFFGLSVSWYLLENRKFQLELLWQIINLLLLSMAWVCVEYYISNLSVVLLFRNLSFIILTLITYLAWLKEKPSVLSPG